MPLLATGCLWGVCADTPPARQPDQPAVGVVVCDYRQCTILLGHPAVHPGATHRLRLRLALCGWQCIVGLCMSHAGELYA